MLTKRIILTLIFLAITGVLIQSQESLARCSEREFLAEFPRVEPSYWCLELPILAGASDHRTYTSMTFAEDGTLYASHPYRGAIVALTDTDGDFLPDTETLIADNLRYPNGITLHDNQLYILGDGIIYKLVDGVVETLVDDLPSGRGFIARGITIHEEMLYVGIPSPCDFCEGDHPLSGTVIRMQLDGTEREVIAKGLRYPAALEIYQDALWVTDIARDAFDIQTFYDEINRIDLNSAEIPHFGFPYCVGADNTPDLESDFDCRTARPPEIALPTRSSPIALQRYDSQTFPHLTGHMMVVLLGSNNSSYIAGHAIFSFAITDEGNIFELIAPVDDTTAGRGTGYPSRWHRVDGLLFHAEFVNNQGGGIFPHYPYDIAVSPEGWLYFSINGKGIYVLRPQT